VYAAELNYKNEPVQASCFVCTSSYVICLKMPGVCTS